MLFRSADSGNWSISIDQLQHLSINQILHNELVLEISLQVLIQGDFDQQWEIAKIIPKLGDIAIQPLLNLLNDTDIDLEDRWVVARILGEFDQPQVVTALIELIQQQEDLELTEIATSALTKIGVPAISALTELLATPDRWPTRPVVFWMDTSSSRADSPPPTITPRSMSSRASVA